MTILNHQISTNGLELKENKSIIEEIKAKNEKLESINKDFINQIQNLHNKIISESRKNSQLTNQICNMEKNIFDLKTIIDKSNKMISDLSKNRDELNFNNNQLKKELDDVNMENNI
jgi:chromosome segregation ATPase